MMLADTRPPVRTLCRSFSHDALDKTPTRRGRRSNCSCRERDGGYPAGGMASQAVRCRPPHTGTRWPARHGATADQGRAWQPCDLSVRMMSVRANLGWPFLPTNTNYTFHPAPPPLWEIGRNTLSTRWLHSLNDPVVAEPSTTTHHNK